MLGQAEKYMKVMTGFNSAAKRIQVRFLALCSSPSFPFATLLLFYFLYSLPFSYCFAVG
jgi:hypothetical protein